MSCISTSVISVLINGRSILFFKPSRGIRQSDYISSYIFIVCMKLLSRRIEYEVDVLNWTLIAIGRRGPKLFHLLFADDLTLFTIADDKNNETVKRVLDTFSFFSRQRINNTKSKIIFSKNCSSDTINNISSNLGIQAINNFGRFWASLSFMIPPQKLISNSLLIRWKPNTLVEKTKYSIMLTEPLLLEPLYTVSQTTYAIHYHSFQS